jgi:DnaJ-class molecular chaperone
MKWNTYTRQMKTTILVLSELWKAYLHKLIAIHLDNKPNLSETNHTFSNKFFQIQEAYNVLKDSK